MTTVTSNTSTLAELRALFPGAILIDRPSLARVLGIKEKTIRNLGRKFPIQPVHVGRSARYRLADAAALIDRSLGIEQAAISAPTAKRGSGRPPNREKAEKTGGVA